MYSFKPIGAVAANVVAQIPLNPEHIFKHISVHMVHMLARMAAKEAVKQELRDQGVRVSLVPPRDQRTGHVLSRAASRGLARSTTARTSAR